MSRRGLVRAREENWKSDRLTGILPGKPDLVKVEWDPAAGSAPSDRNAELSRFARRRDFAFFRSKSQSANDSHSSNRKRPTIPFVQCAAGGAPAFLGVAPFVAAFVIPHPPSPIPPPPSAIRHLSSAIRHLSSAISPSPFPVPHSAFRIPHFLTGGDDATLLTTLEALLNALPAVASTEEAPKLEAHLAAASSDFAALEKLRKLAFTDQVPAPARQMLLPIPTDDVDNDMSEE